MCILDQRWERIGKDCCRLKDEYCFPGTQVFIDQVGFRSYARWHIRMVSVERMRSTECGMTWRIDSKKSWRDPSVARRHALAIRYSHEWLSKLGIDVNDEKYEATELAL